MGLKYNLQQQRKEISIQKLQKDVFLNAVDKFMVLWGVQFLIYNSMGYK